MTLIKKFSILIRTLEARKLLFLIFLSAIFIRISYSLTLEEKWYFYDTVHYDKAAQCLLKGEGFGDHYFFTKAYSLEPAYPIFLAAIYGIFGHHLWVVRIFESFIGAILCLLIFEIGQNIFGRKVAFFAAAIAIFHPYLIFQCGLLYPENLFTAFLCSAVYFNIKLYQQQRMRFSVFAGLSFGLAALSKGIVLSFLPFLAMWLLLPWSKLPFSLRIKSTSILFATIAITLLPWTIRNYIQFNAIAPVRATASIIDEENPDQHDNNLGQFLTGRIKLTTFIENYINEFIYFWAPYPERTKAGQEFKSNTVKVILTIIFIPLYIFAIIGAVCLNEKFYQGLLLILLIFAFAFTYSFFVTTVRYRIPVEPYIILLSAHGFMQAIKYVDKRKMIK